MNADRIRFDAPRALIEAVLEPRTLLDLDMPAWERVVSCARRNAVLAYLAHRATDAGLADEIPDAARTAFASALAATARLAQLARWELERVRKALWPAGIPVIALKGVAYLLRGMSHAATRLVSDIDVMVPHERIGEAEQALLAAGWQHTKLDPYDQAYYRRWSHEIPPLQYPGRLLSVDVHHTICPPVSRLRPDPGAFWRNSAESALPGVGLLSPADSFLHAAVHLFFDSDFDTRFRDLVDLHEMAVAFGAADGFWPALLDEAQRQGLGRPLYYALDTLRHVLRSPMSAAALDAAGTWRPAAPVDLWMTRTLRTLLTPADPEIWPPAHGARRWLMYARSHWLRMPPHVLVPHLARQALRRAAGGEAAGR